MEHFGITPVEAMAAGCVPIVYRGGGLTETVTKDSGFTWKTIDELIKPFKNKHNRNLGMVVGNPLALKPKTFLETTMFQGYKIKKKVFARWKKGINIYTSGGHAMKALSRQFLQSFLFQFCTIPFVRISN